MSENWLYLSVLLAVVGGYQCLRSKNWFWVVVASVTLLYAVPQLATT